VTTASYVDASVILSCIYGQKGAMEPGDLLPVYTSVLTRVECFRSLDRNRRLGRLSDQGMSEGREYLYRTFRTFRVLEIGQAVLDRASDPIAVPLKSLDAIHLTTALLLREDLGGDVTFATHDHGLANAARAYGLGVVGA
jgi:predicted nucleic acid-binding protein